MHNPIDDIAKVLDRIRVKERDDAYALEKRNERLGNMSKAAEAVAVQANERFGNVYLTTTEVGDPDQPPKSYVWAYNIRNRKVEVNSEEVFARYDPEVDPRFFDILAGLIAEKLETYL